MAKHSKTRPGGEVTKARRRRPLVDRGGEAATLPPSVLTIETLAKHMLAVESRARRIFPTADEPDPLGMLAEAKRSHSLSLDVARGQRSLAQKRDAAKSTNESRHRATRAQHALWKKMLARLDNSDEFDTDAAKARYIVEHSPDHPRPSLRRAKVWISRQRQAGRLVRPGTAR